MLNAVRKNLTLGAWVSCFLGLTVSPVVVAQADDTEQFSLNSHIGFGIKASFSGLGGFPAQTDPGPATAGVNHSYDDGYNRVDASGNANGNTWYWGYQSSSQLGPDTISMSSSSSPGTGQLKDVSDDPQGGVELTYAHKFGSNSSYWWGVVLGFGWVNVNIEDSATFTSDVQRLTDTYSLGGIVPPIAPYAGSFNGPGPLIGDSPTRRVDTLAGAATTTGKYSVEGNLYTLRVGLIYQSPFNDRLSLQFGGGGIGGIIDSEFRFSEQVGLAGVGGLTREGSSSDTGVVGGAYGEVGFILRIADHWTATAGVQYQYLSSFDQSVDNKESSLSFKNTLYVQVGIGARF